jgi:O-antigen/teichoic acid export membrane protein
MFSTKRQAELEREKRLPKVVRNVITNWAGSFSSLLIAFFLSPFVVHHLGATAYGAWVLIMSVTGYLGLLDLGVRGTVTRYIARFHTQDKHEEASRLVSTALVIFTLLGALAFVTCVVIASVSPKLFHVPENSEKTFQTVLILAGATIASTLISNVFGATIVGLQRFEVENAIDVSANILRAFAILLALAHGKGLIALAIIHLAFCVATGLTYAWMSWRLYPQLSVRYILSDRTNARLIVSFGGTLFVLQASTFLILYTDAVVISAFLPVAMVTFFTIASNLVASCRSLINGISFAIPPLASSLDAGGNRDKIKLIALMGPRYATMLVLPIVITFVLRGKTFIGLWMGPDYADTSSRVLQVLSVALFFGAANQVTTAMMWGINKHRPVALANLAEGVLNLALSIGLVRWMGIVGVAWGTALPTLATSLVFWPLYMRRVFEIPFSQYVSSTWGRPVVAAIPFALISLIIDKVWEAPTLWVYFFQVVMALPVAALPFWLVCFSQTERRSYLRRILSSTDRVGEPA